jgi:hypothetical protein
LFKLANSFLLPLRTDPTIVVKLNLSGFGDIQLTRILMILKELQIFALENSLKFAQKLKNYR